MVGLINQYQRVVEEENSRKFEDKPLTIKTILKEIDEDKMVVPDFQREYVWKPEKFPLLFDSIYRGYTIGNLLLWETEEKLAHKKIGEKNTLSIDQIKDKKTYTYILDGQQRLTTLYTILRNKEVYREGNKNPKSYKVYFDIINDQFTLETEKLNGENKSIKKLKQLNEFDSFRFIDMSEIFNDQLNFPSNLIKEKEKINDELFQTDKISKEEYFKSRDYLKEKEELLRNFIEIFHKYKIPQIVDRSKDIHSVVTVFERINTQNTQLDIFDIMVAKTYQNVEYKGELYTFRLKSFLNKLLWIKDLGEDKLHPDYIQKEDDDLQYGIYYITILRLLSIILHQKEVVEKSKNTKEVYLQKEDIYNLNANEIQSNYKILRDVLQEINRYLTKQINLKHIDENFVDNKILSFLSYVFVKDSYNNQDHNIINLWFWNTILFNRFPGAQLQLIEKDIKAFNISPNEFKLTIQQRRDFNIFSKEHIGDEKLIDAGYDKLGNLYNSLILLLNTLKPENYDEKDEINIFDYINLKNKNNKHHIIPFKSKGADKIRKEYGEKLGDAILNNIANISLIGSRLNQSISNNDPRDYLPQFLKNENSKRIFKSHLIDEDMIDDLLNERYNEFVIKRTKKILDLIKLKCTIDNETINIIIENEGSED